jgi:hypothetical protein
MRMIRIATLLLLAFACAAPGFCQDDAQGYGDEPPADSPIFSEQPDPIPPDPPPHGDPPPYVPPGGGGGGIVVTYTVPGYRVGGEVSGDIKSGFSSAVSQPSGYPCQANIVPGPYTITMESGENIEFGNTWTFARNDIAPETPYLIRLTYHHGANSVTTWKSVVEYTHKSKKGTVVNTLGPKEVVSGGNFTEERFLPGSLVPRPTPSSPLGATRVDAHRNYGPIPMGDSRLQSVELLTVKSDTPSISKTISFAQSFVGLDESGRPIAAGTQKEIRVQGIGLVEFGCDFANGYASISNITCERVPLQRTKAFNPPTQAQIDAAGGLDGWIAQKASELTVPLESIPHMTAMDEFLVYIGGRPHVAFVLM